MMNEKEERGHKYNQDKKHCLFWSLLGNFKNTKYNRENGESHSLKKGP